MRYLELFAYPFILGKVHNPSGFISEMGKQGLDAVIAIGRDEDISAVTPGAAGEFDKALSALGREIQKLILGQTLTSDVGDTGSYAAAQVHNTVREDKRRADIRLVEKTVRRICTALWTLNSLPGDAPTFIMQDDASTDLDWAKVDIEFVKAGALRLTDSYFLKRPDLEPEDFTIPPTSAPVMGAPLTAQRGVELSAPVPRRFTADQEAVEAFANQVLLEAKSPIPAAQIRAAILDAHNPEDLANRLIELYRDNDSQAFAELMERSLFAADVMGYVAAETAKA
jgi:phage gp29-like protein